MIGRQRLHSWLESFGVYRDHRVLAMLFLGFSAGLPILLVFGTLSAWLNNEAVDKTTIGFVSWVALAYGLKFTWSPLVDRLSLPLLTPWLGKRRSWMLLAQAGVITGLIAMSMSDPKTDLAVVVAFAVLTAFSSATQDITIDAWRIEAIEDEYQGAMASIRQASMVMSCVAEENAVNTANATTTARSVFGSLNDMAMRPVMTPACANNIQLRL